jgi:hypothetical protein
MAILLRLNEETTEENPDSEMFDVDIDEVRDQLGIGDKYLKAHGLGTVGNKSDKIQTVTCHEKIRNL